jgi:hypothetical protein
MIVCGSASGSAGHRDANATWAVYVREAPDARRRTMRRSRMVAEFSDVLGVDRSD